MVLGPGRSLFILYAEQHVLIGLKLSFVSFLVIDELEDLGDRIIHFHLEGEFLELKVIRNLNLDLPEALRFQFPLNLFVQKRLALRS